MRRPERWLALEKNAAGIASPTEVGEWVEQMAGPALAARTQAIGLIERTSTSGVTAVSGFRASSSHAWRGIRALI